MGKIFKTNNSGGATIEYAIFLCIASVLFVSTIAYLGNEYRPQLTAWHQGVEIDNTAVGSISRTSTGIINRSLTKEQIDPDNVKTYRVYQLPKGLLPEK